MPASVPVRVEFQDFVDVQTRVVLLPFVEEEGLGAMVASYTPSLGKENKNAANKEPEVKSMSSEEPSDDSMQDIELKTNSVDGNVCNRVGKEQADPDMASSSSEEGEESHHDSNPQDVTPVASAEESSLTQQDIVGSVLVGIELKDNHDEEWTRKDFSDILSSIRDAPTPIVLCFQHMPATDEHGEAEGKAKNTSRAMEDDDDTVHSTESSASDCEEEHTNPAKVDPRNLFGDRLSNWSSQIRATSAQLAADAASGAATLSSKVKTAANEASERAKASSDLTAGHQLNRPCCRMFLQLPSGQFACVPSTRGGAKVSTASVLLMRESETEPCPPNKYCFQWFRSCDLAPTSDDRSRSSASADGRSRTSSYDERSKASSERSLNGSINSDSEIQWSMLPNASFAAYQPSATDVGHRLRCVVTLADESDEDSDSDEESMHERCEAFETPERIIADMTLFNAARQALLRGAKFGSLKGRGNAEGRIFLVCVEISRSSHDRKAEIANAVTISQVSGNTTEPLCENGEAFLNVSAISDPTQAKCFELVFSCIPDSSSLVSALCTDGKFQLEAPNRITRESLLLALGIANFKGKPANLNVSTVLYPGSPSGSLSGTPDRSLDNISVGISTVSAITKDGSVYCTPGASIGSPLSGSIDCNGRMQEIEKELQRDLKSMRKKLAKKDKVVSDLHRQLAVSDSKLQQSNTALSSCKKENEHTVKSLKLAERRIATHEADMKRVKGDHARQVTSIETQLKSQAKKMAEMEKMMRSLQNEKAVLSAAVDARDSKLTKMEGLQSSVQSLNTEVQKGEALRTEFNALYEKCGDLSVELERTQKSEKEHREELERSNAVVEQLKSRIVQEQKKSKACQARLASLGAETQKLKAERNGSKQKADSLAKEIARICRNGLQISDVERIVQDEESRRTEVSLLRAQKRKAMEELELYRTAFDQSVAAQSRSNINGEAVRALEQKSELERVVADLTEYVNAKEMQMETLKLVNASLQDELRMLRQEKLSEQQDT